MRTKKSFQIVLVTLILAAVSTGAAYAGACLCVKENMEGEVVEFTCVNLAAGGAAECSNHCKDAGFSGYSWHSDETCDSLYKKIKKQKIDIDIIDIITTVTDITERIDNGVVGGFGFNGPINASLEVITGSATFLGNNDTFDVPKALGGGSHSTSAFSGVLDFKMVQTAPGSSQYDVFVTSVSTVTASMDLNGFKTGVLRGELNKEGANAGTYDKDTGQISFLFSEILTSDTYPQWPVETWSYYYGSCNDCLNNGSMTLDGDSFYIAPWE